MKKQTAAPAIETGLDAEARRRVADGLSHVLADTYALYVKTQNFHWNVTGPMFQTLHTMFETQYKELANAADLLAERIRALGHPAPGSFSKFSELTSIEDANSVPEAKEMIRQLLSGHETVVRTARTAFASADSSGDEVTSNMLADRMEEHEKTAWMLRSLLA